MIGRSIAHYCVTAKIGAGGMGEVWRATDTKLRRDVALKVLPEIFAGDAERMTRFAREAQVLAALNHPNIASIYGLEEAGGVRCLILEFVDGETLLSRINSGPLALEEALSIGLQVAEALDAAHEKGIVHRDLKPANIKITPDGKVKVLDFGLARALAADPRSATVDSSDSPTLTLAATQQGTILGTAAYMSPEQARGRAVDRRADIWAFGVVLLEMLTGRQTFTGETVSDTLAAVLKTEPDWSALPAATPHLIRRLLRRCLEKDPRRRLRDIGDARLELEDAAAGELDAPAGARPETGRWRSATAAWMVAGAAVLVAVGAVVLSAPRVPAGRAAMRFSSVTNFAGVEAQPSLSPDGRSVAFVSNRDGQWDVYVGLIAGGSLVRVTSDPNLETWPRWSPDGTRLLFARLNDMGLNDIWVVPALGGGARRIILNGMTPSWSPDGRSIAYASGGAIWVCEASGANPRAVTRPEPPLLDVQPTFSRDGRSLAFVRRRDAPFGELAVADVVTGDVKTLTGDGALALSPAWSPGDRFIYFTSSRGGVMNIWKVSTDSGEPEQVTVGPGEDVDVDLSADGKRLVFSSLRANESLAELSLDPGSRGRLTWLTASPASFEATPQYSPDGRLIAYFSHRTGAEREGIWVMDTDGANARKLVEDGRVNVHPRWTGNGDELVYLSRVGGVLGGQELRRVPLGGGAPQGLSIQSWGGAWGDVAPDGRLAYRTGPRTGEVYDPRTNQRQPIADLPSDPWWSPDGRLLAFAIRPDRAEAHEAGLWIEEPSGARRQVFPGWVAYFAWAGADELLVLEGKPDLTGLLWRVNVGGRRSVVSSGVPLLLRPDLVAMTCRFDVHPDGRRIVIEAYESFEWDIGMIDNVW